MAHCFMFLRTVNKCLIPLVLKPNRLSAIHWQYYSTQLLARVVDYPKHLHPYYDQLGLSQCQMSSAKLEPESGPNLNYDDVIKLKKKGEIILIDVRDPLEIQEAGNLPDSINIPLQELESALQTLSEEEFKLKYGMPKPTEDAPLVFSCLSGGRSKKALAKAIQMGYKNARNYQGGFSDWQEKSKEE